MRCGPNSKCKPKSQRATFLNADFCAKKLNESNPRNMFRTGTGSVLRIVLTPKVECTPASNMLNTWGEKEFAHSGWIPITEGE